MNKKIKARWVKALLSGRYKQVTGTLQNTDGNCCLGVLCRIERLKSTKVLNTDWRQFYWKDVAEGEHGVLPYDFMKWAGVSSDQQSELIAMNDEGSTFKDIAKWIRKNL